MIGSTFIAESDRSKLATLESAEDLVNFTYVDLDCTTTIDFVVTLDANGVKWEEDGDPISYVEDGVALCKISEPGLAYGLKPHRRFSERSSRRPPQTRILRERAWHGAHLRICDMVTTAPTPISLMTPANGVIASSRSRLFISPEVCTIDQLLAPAVGILLLLFNKRNTVMG